LGWLNWFDWLFGLFSRRLIPLTPDPCPSAFIRAPLKDFSAEGCFKHAVFPVASVGKAFLPTQSWRLSSLPQIQGGRRGAIVSYAPRRPTPKMRGEIGNPAGFRLLRGKTIDNLLKS